MQKPPDMFLGGALNFFRLLKVDPILLRLGRDRLSQRD